MDLLTWHPLHSKQVREILDHATPSERSRYIGLSTAFGVVFGILAAIPSGAIAVSLSFGISPENKLLVWTLVGAAVLLTFGIMVFSRSAVSRMLCSFEWAREQGITPKTLKLQGR